MSQTAVVGPRFFEDLHLGATDERTLVHDTVHGMENLVRDLRVLSSQINERHGGSGRGTHV